MTTDEDASQRADALLTKLNKMREEIAASSKHTTELLDLNARLVKEQRRNARFLIDKFLPILTAILGGVSYVLVEHKATAGWPLICFQVSGVCLVLAILVIFIRTWLDPFIDYNFKEQLLAIRSNMPKPKEPFIFRHSDAIEGVSVILVAVLVLAGLVSGSLATMIQSEAAVTPPHQLAPAHDVK